MDKTEDAFSLAWLLSAGPLERGDLRRGAPPQLTLFLGTGQSQEERASKGRKGARPSQGTSRLGACHCRHLAGARCCSKAYPTLPGLPLTQSHPCLPDFTLAQVAVLALKTEPCLRAACGAPPPQASKPSHRWAAAHNAKQEARQGCTPQQQAAQASTTPSPV